MTEVTCPECGKAFQRDDDYWRRARQRFCSRSCRLKAWRRERHEADPEKVRAEWRKAHEHNRGKRLARMKQYHLAHRDEALVQRKEWHHAHRDEQNTRRLAHYYDHQEEANQRRSDNNQKTRLASPWKSLLKGANERAIRKDVPFTLTDEWAALRWTGRCELTNIEFGIGQRTSGPKMFSPSIDRIEPAKGYVPGNCRFILWAVNAFKGEGSDIDMALIARALVLRLDTT